MAARCPQDDEQFLADCRVGGSRERAVAIAVRQAVARSCGVNAECIRASDGFLTELYTIWGEDSLDAVGFWVDLQARLGLLVPVRDAERIRTPFARDRTVAEMVRNVCDVVDCK